MRSRTLHSYVPGKKKKYDMIQVRWDPSVEILLTWESIHLRVKTHPKGDLDSGVSLPQFFFFPSLGVGIHLNESKDYRLLFPQAYLLPLLLLQMMRTMLARHPQHSPPIKTYRILINTFFFFFDKGMTSYVTVRSVSTKNHEETCFVLSVSYI